MWQVPSALCESNVRVFERDDGLSCLDDPGLTAAVVGKDGLNACRDVVWMRESKAVGLQF